MSHQVSIVDQTNRLQVTVYSCGKRMGSDGAELHGNKLVMPHFVESHVCHAKTVQKRWFNVS